MSIVMGLTVHNPALFYLAEKCIASANEGSVKPDSIIVVDNSPQTTFANFYYPCGVFPEIEIVSFGRNVGLTGTWNYLFTRFSEEDYLILPGDDCVFYAHTIEYMLEELHRNQEAMIVCPKDQNGNPLYWSLFAQRTKLYRDVGPYDEIYQVYYADNSYSWRMKLAGYPEEAISVVDTEAYHHGSAHVKAATGEYLERHNRQWYFASELYPRMWGGLVGSESYLQPFNGVDAQAIIQELKQKHGVQ